MEIYKDIDPTNLKGQLHGYQEWYAENKLWIRGLVRCNYKNGQEIGYEEWHNNTQTNFYIK